MTPEEVHNLPKEHVVALLEICRKSMRFQDGFWFMNVEDTWGIDKAIEIDAHIWSRFGKYEAQLLLKAFPWEKRGIPTLVRAIRFAPSWLFFDYSIEQISDTDAVLQVKKCLAQTGRLKGGKNVFACRKVDEGYLTNFARVIDPKIKVTCDFAPPEKYFDNLWCSWRFSIDASED
jgi:hypothetical protein